MALSPIRGLKVGGLLRLHGNYLYEFKSAIPRIA